MFGITFGCGEPRARQGHRAEFWHTVCLPDASFHSAGAQAPHLGNDAIKLGPFSFLKLSVGLYRPAPVAPLSANAQADLLRELHADYPSLQQIPGGVIFSDTPRGRMLLIDQTKVESVENNPNSPFDAIERMHGVFQKAVPVVQYPAPFHVRIDGAGTIQAMEGLNPAQVLLRHASPREDWTSLAGECTFAGLRYIFRSDDGGQRDVHVEPLFAQPDKFYVMVLSVPGAGAPSLDNAMERARRETEIIERLSDRVVSDLASS
ncbi:MAG: hypothetical protein M3Z41_08875 [Candidatus Eremiobacteraeota bacterium]|nr:hypothetical protein [Candidatus Eremiobacteraeota bacterium]